MSWIVENTLTPFQRFCVNVLKCGPVPKHIAFIMDGNRRYASKARVEKSEGHYKGFNKLSETLQWCSSLGVTEVTVYAFSIENFKRSREEVDTLMLLAEEKFRRLLDEKEKLMNEGICIRVIGDLTLLPAGVRKLIAEAILLTKDNKSVFLNVAFAYTSREEITTSIKTVVDGVKKCEIEADDVNEALLTRCLYTGQSPDPDIIIRTSGEVRFSDFLLWQIGSANICFADVLWPEFCIWHLLAAIFQYQRCYKSLKEHKEKKLAAKLGARAERFVEKVEEERLANLRVFANA